VSVPTIDTDLARKAKEGTGTFRVEVEHARSSERARARAAEALALGRVLIAECREEATPQLI
jgi:hypothetical protein